MPRKEKSFFTVYAMNLMVGSDGLESLRNQKQKDVEAFIRLPRRFGAKQTANAVRTNLAASKKKTSEDRYESNANYYKLFNREKIWLKVLDYLGRRIYVGYVLRAQAIQNSGGSLWDPKQWEDDLPRPDN